MWEIQLSDLLNKTTGCAELTRLALTLETAKLYERKIKHFKNNKKCPSLAVDDFQAIEVTCN